MSNTITSTGEYKRKSTGENVTFEFSYPDFGGDLEAMIEEQGRDVVAKNNQRMVKLDASNTARESAKVANGDSTRVALSEAEKAANKADRAETKSVLSIMKAKAKEAGMTLAEYAASI